jgi:hypothetical protein
MTSLKIYQDQNRFIIGRSEWQSCLSMTVGVLETYSRKAAIAERKRLEALPLETLEAAKKTYWTDGRFEVACDAGRFGAAWN